MLFSYSSLSSLSFLGLHFVLICLIPQFFKPSPIFVILEVFHPPFEGNSRIHYSLLRKGGWHYRMFGIRQYFSLDRTFDEYHQISEKRTIEDAIRSEMSGDLKDGMLAVVKCCRSKPAFLAEQLYKSMKGKGPVILFAQIPTFFEWWIFSHPLFLFRNILHHSINSWWYMSWSVSFSFEWAPYWYILCGI